ncbi:hypothetical protein E2C01_054698 [Portunus trituberculatus]|uniref:Uncharacterized protein n=1 Tax=Portunus trituberculatus TaxID=210409 RepID=A0A5B7GSR9_PORTR|nr:hypothetical protein [Portunus trituberculatus]
MKIKIILKSEFLVWSSRYKVLTRTEGKLAKGNKKWIKEAHWIDSSLKVIKSYPKDRDKCLETSLLKEVKS